MDLGRDVNITTDSVLELNRRKRALIWGVLKSVVEAVKKAKNIQLCGHLFDLSVLQDTRVIRKQDKHAKREDRRLDCPKIPQFGMRATAGFSPGDTSFYF